MNQQSKPKKSRSHRLIEHFLSEVYWEEFLGDLEEMHEERLETNGRRWARFMYWFDTLHLLYGFTKIKIFNTQKGQNMLINNMFKIAWRNAIRQKQFTFLNVVGLTLGIATCLIIGLYVHNESTFDTFHEKGDHIYRVNQPMIWNDWDAQFASTGPNVAVALREDAPEFEAVTRILSLGPQTLRSTQEGRARTLLKEERYFAADENFFDVFTFKALDGDLQTALTDPMSLVVTKSTAERYFGYEPALGKFIEVKEVDGSWRAYAIKAIIEDIPTKSHLQFDFLVSFDSHPEYIRGNEWKWIFTAFSTYGLVKEGTDMNALTAKIQDIPPKWAPATTERIFNQKYTDFTRGKPWTLFLQPLREVYLSSSPVSHRFGPTGNPLFVQVFAAVGVLVLILSCINFMNLSTARSAHRAKEVGVRKVLGSGRTLLAWQFIVESVLYVALSAILALGLVFWSLDAFNSLSGLELSVAQQFSNVSFWVLLIVFVLGLGILAGSYPAFYLSAFQPIQSLKSKGGKGLKGKRVRDGLVVFQFAISVGLVICSLFVQRQLSYTSSRDLGLSEDNILEIHNVEQLGEKVELLKVALAENPVFSKMGVSYATPPNVWDGERYKAPGDGAPSADMSNFRTDGAYLELLELEFLAGRNFDPNRATDKHGVVINEEAARLLGWGTKDTFEEDSPIGKDVICAFDNEAALEVLGVVKDFNFNSLRQEIAPLIIMHNENDLIWNYGWGKKYLSLRLNTDRISNSLDLRTTIDFVETELAKIDESILFEFSFMDQEFENAFRSEERMGGILNVFTAMAIIIACLGLFGLAAFSAEQRRKELGIRKVLGAKLATLIYLFSTDFAKLIVISILIAAPAAYFIIDGWLESFAYRTPIEVPVFLLAIVSTLLVGILTVSYQSFLAASRNPAETLMDE